MPWYNMLPHAAYSQFNLDWLISKWGEYDSRIKTLEDNDKVQDQRLDEAESDIDDLQGRMTSAEDRLTSAEGRITVNEGNITTIFGKLETDEADIDNLKSRMTTAEGSITTLQSTVTTQGADITSLTGRVQQNETDIAALQTENRGQANDITALDNRLDVVEANEVVANPGGSGITLNTLKVGSQVYSVPQGGGGSGSVVTANPAGVLPTDPELSALGIDSYNYRIPVTAADKAAIESDISDLDDRIDAVEASIGEINELVVDKAITFRTAQSGSSVIEVTDSDFTLGPGLYIVDFYSEIDTSNFGSAQRDIGLYLRDSNNDNLRMDKFHINGTETPSITQAAILQFNNILKVNATATYHAGLRCQKYTGSAETYDYELWIKVVKLGNIGS